MSVFGVILVRIFPHSDWIRTRITPNTNTFYPVIFRWNASYLVKNLVFFHAITAKKPLREKCPNMEFFLAHIFPHSGSVSLRFQSECEKIRTRKNSVFGYFWSSEDMQKSTPSLWKWDLSKAIFTCLNLIMKTSKQCLKSVQSWQWKHRKDWLYSDVLFVNFDR